MNAMDVLRVDDVKRCELAIKRRQHKRKSPWVNVWRQMNNESISVAKP